MADGKNKVIRLDGRTWQGAPRTEEKATDRQHSAEVIAAPGVVKAAQELMDEVLRGDVVGVSIITYAKDWSFEISNAGSVLRVPGAGIIAGHMLTSDMENRLRAECGV